MQATWCQQVHGIATWPAERSPRIAFRRKMVLYTLQVAYDAVPERTGPGSTTLPRTCCSRTRTSETRWKREPLQSYSQGSLILIPAQNPLHPHGGGSARRGARVQVLAAVQALSLGRNLLCNLS